MNNNTTLKSRMMATILSIVAALACTLALTLPAQSAYAADAVCTVNGTEYSDIATAVAEAPDNATITLLSNIETAEAITVKGKSLKFDLAGNTLTCKSIKSTYASTSLELSNGAVNGIVTATNLALNKVTVTGESEKTSVVTVNTGSTITDSSITNTWSSKNSYTTSALALKGNGTHSITATSLTGKSALYIDSTTAAIDNCTLTGTVEGSYAVEAFSNDEVHVTIVNSTIDGSIDNKALSTSWNMAGTFELGEGNLVKGSIKVSGRDNSTNVYELKVTGGTFESGSNPPFVPQASNFEPQMLERLNVTGGQFSSSEIANVLRSGYTCYENSNGYWKVSDDITAAGFYTIATNGAKVKHASIAEAIENGEGTVFFARSNTLSAEDVATIDEAGRTLSCAPAVIASYDDSAKDLLASLKNGSLENANIEVKGADGAETLRGLSTSAGKIIACTTGITDSNASAYTPLLAEGYVLDGSSTAAEKQYRVIEQPSEGALIGSIWYPDLDRAVVAASIDDASSPVNETILMLSDYDSTIEVVYPNSTFTIDLDDHTINGGSSNGVVIAPVVSSNVVPHGANITLIDGTIKAGELGVAINGTVNDVSLTLEDMKIESSQHGMYLAGEGRTSIINSVIEGADVGIEIRAGEITIDQTSIVTGGIGTPSVSPNASGTTASNAALAVTQHTTKLPIKVTIEGGTFTGGAALLEADPQGNNPENVSLAVMGGEFEGLVTSEDCDSFISGGSFSDPNAVAFVPEGNTLFAQTGSDLFVVTPLEEAMSKAEATVPFQGGQVYYESKEQAESDKQDAGITAPNSFKVTFEGESVTMVPVFVEENATVPTPADPVRDGFVFSGWFNGDQKWDFNTAVTEPLTLTAHWKAENSGEEDDQDNQGGTVVDPDDQGDSKGDQTGNGKDSDSESADKDSNALPATSDSIGALAFVIGAIAIVAFVLILLAFKRIRHR